MTREEFIKQRCEIDKITEEELKKQLDCGRVQFVKLLMTKERENKELKKQYENAVADYETIMAEKNKLKRQVEDIIEELELVRCDLHNRTSERDGAEKQNDLYKSQQQEFINYLEDESKEIYRDGGLRQNIYKEILQKYKSIIGVSDENTIK